jgi:hypothetical protein
MSDTANPLAQMRPELRGVLLARSQARKWCAENQGWQPICDMDGTDHLYYGWEDLSKSAKISWRLKYGDSAPAIYDYQQTACKVATGFIDELGNFTKGVPFGVVGMMVFNTGALR